MESDNILSFGCGREDIAGYVAAACHLPSPPAGDPLAALAPSAEASVLALLQEQAYEYLVLQAGAAVPAERPVNLPRDACIAEGSPAAQLRASLPSSVTGTQVSLATGERRSQLDKFYAVSTQSDPRNLVRAVMMSDNLAYQAGQRCANEEQAGRNAGFCTNVQNGLSRIQNAYPSLFPGGRSRNLEGTLGGGSEAPRTQALREAVQLLMGTHGAESSDRADRAARGRGFYEAAMRNGATDVNALGALGDRLDAAETAATASGANPTLAAAYAEAQAVVPLLNADHRQRVTTQARQLCGRDLRHLLVEYPNVVRQMMVDLPPESRALAKAVLCRSYTYLREAQSLEQCDGVTADFSDPRQQRIRVDRTMWDFPYVSQNNYTLGRPWAPPNAPIEVALTVNVAVWPGYANESRPVLQRWQQYASDFYRCQSGEVASFVDADGASVACPPRNPENRPSPPVRFRIQVRPVPLDSTERPLIRLERCYRAELDPPDDSNCDRVRQFAVRDCIRSSPGNPNAAAQCEASTPPATSQLNNREDSGTMTLTTPPATITHEFGHLLGLADEYRDSGHVLNDVGEPDSVMSAPPGPGLRLYPRHLRRIVSAQSCPAGAAP